MIFPDLPALGTGSTILVALIAIAFGLLNCFFGYRIFRVLLAVYGFILGVIVGTVVAGSVAPGQTLWLIVGAAAGGILGAILMVLLYFVGVFVVGAAAGALLANAIGAVAGITMPTVVVVIVAVAVGILALIFQRVVLVVLTALAGAWGMVSGGVLLFAGHPLPAVSIVTQQATWEQTNLSMLVVLIAWLALGIAGTIVQLRTTREQPAATSRQRVDGPRDVW